MTVIWDWNGTLLNDVVLCNEILNDMLIEHGYAKVGDINAYRNIFGFPIIDYYKKAGFDFNRHSFDMLAEKFMSRFNAKCYSLELQPNANEILSYINKKGIRQIVLSASPIDILQKQVEHYFHFNYFDKLLGLNDIYAKSKIELAKHYFKQSNEKGENCILIGDTEHDFEVANALNIKKCILCNKGHQSIEALNKTGAVIIDDLLMLKNHI